MKQPTKPLQPACLRKHLNGIGLRLLVILSILCSAIGFRPSVASAAQAADNLLEQNAIIAADPVFTQEAYLKSIAPNFEYAFGSAIAVDGNTVVIGEPESGGGVVSVFVRNGSTWSLQARLTASNADFDDRFGSSLAISGDTIVVGAPREDSNAVGVNGNPNDNNAFDAGAAYVFVRNGTTWNQQAYLKAPNTDGGVAPYINGDLFGYAVSISNDTIVVGAPSEDSNATGINGNQNDNTSSGAGAAYVFKRNGNSWEFSTYLKSSNTGLSDGFGWSVDVNTDTIVVGAPYEDSNAQSINDDQSNNSSSAAGAAYIFAQDGTSWVQQAYVKASNTESINTNIEGDEFGINLMIRGDMLVVGAPREASNSIGVNGDQNDNSATNAGATYVFVRNGTTWSQQAYLKASNTNANDAFGVSLAIDGDLLVVGAPGESSNATGINGNQNDNSLGSAGAAYLFRRSGTTWTQENYIKASNTDAHDGFGGSMALSGSILVISAGGEGSRATGINGDQSNDDFTGAGAAYAFTSSAAPTPTCAGLVQEAESSNAILTGFTASADGAASGGQYITSLSSGGFYNGPSPSYKAEYCFNVATAGTYRIKAKSYAANDLSDSFYVTVDGAPAAGYLWDVLTNTSYASDYVNDRNNADPVEVQLSAGQHYVTIYLREQGTRLDTIELEQVPTSPDPVCAGLVQEAESGVINGDWEIGGDLAASGGQYIAAPNGSGDFWNGASGSQKASYCFNVATAGSYRIRGKVYGADTLSDSFYVNVDGSPTTGYLWDVLSNTSYASDYVSDRGVVDPVEVQLSAGQHTVNVFVREDGTRLDTIELQLVDSGPPPTPTCAGLNQEAETGALFGNFAIGSDGAASGGQYVGTPVGSGDFWNGPNANHKAEYCFNVDTAGSYRIDGKVYGADSLSDSFYVQVDGQPTNGYLWDILPNTTYAVDAVNDRNQLLDTIIVNLSAGQHTVTVYAREAGTRLDALQLVSTLPSVQSRALSPLAAGIGGTVKLNVANLSREIDFSTITVKLLDAETNGAEFSQIVTADRFGNFHFDGMTPGSYIVQLSLPDGLVAELAEATVEATRDEPVTVGFEVSGGSAGGKLYLPLIGR